MDMHLVITLILLSVFATAGLLISTSVNGFEKMPCLLSTPHIMPLVMVPNAKIMIGIQNLIDF